MALIEQPQQQEEEQSRISLPSSSSSSSLVIDQVYSIIRDNSGKVRSVDLDEIIGNKYNVRYAITRLTVMGRISRKRGLGPNGIEYYYHDTSSETFSKFRKMELRAFNQIIQKP